MAQCENCGSKGHDMRDMASDAEKKMFIGPCCVSANSAQMFEKSELHYGLEISSHMGVRAYATYNGLSVEFKKSKEEIQTWLQETKEEVQPNPVESQTSSESQIRN